MPSIPGTSMADGRRFVEKGCRRPHRNSPRQNRECVGRIRDGRHRNRSASWDEARRSVLYDPLMRGMWLILFAAVLWGTTGTAQELGPAAASPLAVGSLH